jgi:DNA polymerase family B
LEYNEQDCRGLYEVLDSFFEQTGIRSETFATHALRYWRKEFLQFTIWKPHDNVTDFIRRGLHGGHVDVLKRSGHLRCYDVNSMYPFVMQYPVPIQYVAESRRLTDTLYGFVEAIVEVPEMYIPPLPYKIEKLFFPVGRLRAVWTSEELMEAEQRGARIIRIIKAYYFQTACIFAEYVEKLYALKRMATEPTRTIAKYLLNSLFGKFGQHPEKKVYVSEEQAPGGAFPVVHPDTGEPSGFAYYTRRSRSAYLLPHISASITSKARMVLLQKLNEASYYCDTDSVFTTKRMHTGDKLGQWSLVGVGDATFYQPKLYKFKGVWKAKGLNTKQSIDAFIDGDINQIIRRKSIKEALRTGTPACEDVEIHKQMGGTRPKRAWLAGELDTRPWSVKELEE